MISEIDIASYQPTTVAEADHYGRTDTSLVMPAQVVHEPDKHDRLRDVAAGCDEVDSEVADADRDGFLAEEEDVTYRGDYETCHGEGVAVAVVICQEGCDERDYGGYDVDRYRHNLGVDIGPVKLFENGGGEEGRRVAVIGHT